MPHRTSTPTSHRVVIVASSGDTRAKLQRYMEDAGVPTGVTHRLVATAVPEETAAIVVFPDDFSEEAVLSYLRAVCTARPRAVLVAVTRYPQRFENIATADRQLLNVIVLPRPSFVWAIRDAIRPQTH